MPISFPPGSGGGGASLLRGSGNLLGWTSYTPPTSPTAATLVFPMPTMSVDIERTFEFTVDAASPVTWSFAPSDPADGSTWIGAASGDPVTDAAALAGAVNGYNGCTASADGSGNVTVTSGTTGASSLVGVTAPDLTPTTQSINGSDGDPAVGPSGQVTTVDLLAAVAGKTSKVVAVYAQAIGITSWAGVLTLKYADGTVIVTRTLSSAANGVLEVFKDAGGLTAANLLAGVVNSKVQASFAPSGDDVAGNMPGGTLALVAIATQD